MNLQDVVQKFINNPKYLDNGSGSLATRWNCSREDIIEGKRMAREHINSSNKLWLQNVEEFIKKERNKKEEEIFINTSPIKNDTLLNFPGKYASSIEEKKVNNEKGTLESSVETTFEPKDDIELAKLHKIDLSKYYIRNYYSKLKSTGKFTSTVFCSLIQQNSPENFQEEFKEFLKDFKPSPVIIKNEYVSKKPKVSLILPKQDAHFNKLDIYGDNDIEKRFSKNQKSILNFLLKAVSTNFIDEIVYIVGSDQFNSEWTNLTTKGTPQQNILSYQAAFTEICNHEVEVLNTLLHFSSKVKIYFIPGNHDQFVGWHLINWLEMYYRENKNLSFNTSIENTKYYRFNNSGIMFNHGDSIKPKDLAGKFPIGFKDEWSLCNHYFIFTGDKHHELSLDINGIKFYQIPQLSSAKSSWDDKQGYLYSKAEMTAFVITETKGISDIYKEIL